MAKILGKDPVKYTKERDGFIRDLQHFHDTRGTPFRRPPKINGHEIDLYLLYSLVTTEGGWIKVNSRNEWPELFEKFELPGKCVNAGVALKQIYLRYLDRWEKVHYLGEEADRGSDDDEESRHKRWSVRALHSVPHTYNYQQHNVAEAYRDYNNLSTDLYKASDYDRLGLSLISPLPNEQDFAINVCTLLSNDGKHTIKLEKHPRIIDYLTAHAGVFNHSSLRKLFTNYYGTVRRHTVHSFWKDVLEIEEFVDLTNEEIFPIKKDVPVKEESPEDVPKSSDLLVDTPIPQCSVVVENNPSDLIKSELALTESIDCLTDSIPKGKGVKLKLDSDDSDSELFCLGRTLGTQDYIGQRILQVATILRNLSFIDENIPILAKHQTFLRFLLLCSGSKWAHLHNLGLDMLGNISTEFLIKDLQSDKLATYLLQVVAKGLQSEDRSYCISSLEVLNKLSQTEQNEEVLLKSLESDVYRKVCSFLTLHDVMLLIYTLECLYSLSSLGERACNSIVNNHGVVDTLVSLVTVEGKSYGPKACIGMKLVETVPGSLTVTSNSTATTSVNVTTAASSSASTVSLSTTNTIGSLSLTTMQATTIKTTASTTPVRPVAIQPQRLIAISPATSVTTTSSMTQVTQLITPQQLVQQQHAHQQAIQENEQFALAWLRATYEPVNSSRIDHQELYKHYINSCAKIGRRGVIAPLHFPRCVRSVFGGTVGPNPVKPANSNDPQYYEGIKIRAQPLVINIQQAPNITQHTTQQVPIKAVRRKGQVVSTATPNVILIQENADTPPPSPASPILKAQLSAPSKTREGTKDMKSQVMAHPHLSQALLGSGNSTPGSSKDSLAGQSNTSLIKSLLATKVNECMTPVSMKAATDCQSVAQVAARQQQQRLLAQQTNNPGTPNSKTPIQPKINSTPKSSRINGARQLFSDDLDSTIRPQPPPPPLAPLSNTRTMTPKVENEDSDSTGNNSLASSSGGVGNIGFSGISSTEDGDNSLTSFEGLLNGIPNIDSTLNINEDSNSKDSLKSSVIISKNKPLMLADLLEKKVDKDPPILNGMLGKELRIGEKGLELVENHIEKALSKEANEKRLEINKIKDETDDVKVKSECMDVDLKQGIKRSANDDIMNFEAKRPLLDTQKASVNGTANVDSPAPDSTSSSNSEEGTGTVSTAAAKLFADIAADILEDEEEELRQENVDESAGIVQVVQNNTMQQMFVDNNQQVIVTQPRQIIVSQPQMQTTNQVVITTCAQIKGQNTPQAVFVQSSGQQRTPVVLQQSNTGQILLSQGMQGQVQLVPSTTQPGQYILQTSSSQPTYMVAQSQTAVVHGQPQTVLVAQTPQQQATGAKTIIILQQQPAVGTATHHQKVVVTPQGQQVVVTQVQRPLLQSSSVSNNIIPTSTVIKASNAAIITQNNTLCTTTLVEKKVEEPKIPPKPKIIRDLTTPFVCEWGDCQIDTKFKSANEVYLHVCAAHCIDTNDEITCQWDRCDNMKRKRFSLMTHLHDKHCNTEAMKTSLTKRKQVSQSGKVEVPTTSTATPHPGYAPDAALHAIKRHALEFVNPKELQKTTSKQGTTATAAAAPRSGPSPPEQDDNEGPVTKCIRLTASLILRNLVIYSNNCRRYLRHYEPHLANVALSNVESSRTIAQILYDMNEGVNHR